jgi:hypothetical protein
VIYDSDVDGEPDEPAVLVKRARDLHRYERDDSYSRLTRLPNGTLFGGGDFERERVAAEREEGVEKLHLSPTQRRLLRERSSRRLEEIRTWLEGEAREAGHTLDELLATVTRGPIAANERSRYDCLALRVARMRTAVTLEVIGMVIGKNRQTVLRLETRGRAIVDDPPSCQRHSAHKVDCPACARLVP